MTCLKIDYDWVRRCNQKTEHWIICAKTYKSKNYKHGVRECIVKKRKIYVYIVPKCANYRGNYQANAFKCLAKQKTQAII